MYTLYGMTGSCSMAVHVILEELKQQYKYIDVRVPAGQSKPAEFLKANPRGSVPVLVEEDGTVIREGGAIITYLTDKHNSPLLPKGLARGKALEWLMFANATLHPTYAKVFHALGSTQDAAQKDQLITTTLERINTLWADVNTQLGKSKYVAGDEVTAGDILLSVIANWLQSNYGSKITLGENTKRMIKAVTARPAFQKALGDEKVTYNAAA